MKRSRRTLARHNLILATLAIGFIVAGCENQIQLGHGVHAPLLPQQTVTEAPTLELNDFLLEPQADFAITAKLLSKRRYRWDRLSDIAPWDYAMGWGPMSDEALLEWVGITQGDRFLFRHRRDRRLNLRTIEQNSANLHLIPASDVVESQLASVPVGAIATLAGQLVHALDRTQGRQLRSSLSRDDTGPGACEILYVQRVEIQRL